MARFKRGQAGYVAKGVDPSAKPKEKKKRKVTRSVRGGKGYVAKGVDPTPQKASVPLPDMGAAPAAPAAPEMAATETDTGFMAGLAGKLGLAGAREKAIETMGGTGFSTKIGLMALGTVGGAKYGPKFTGSSASMRGGSGKAGFEAVKNFANQYNYASLVRSGSKITQDLLRKQITIKAAGQAYWAGFKSLSVGTIKTAGGVASRVQGNTKSISTAAAHIMKKTDRTVWSKAGHAMLWAAGAALLGLWGQAEAPEGIAFPLTKLTEQARKTDDWTEVDLAVEERDEIIGLPLWQAPFLGVINKIKGIAAGAKVMDTYIAGEKQRIAEGMDDQTFWANYQANKVADELMLIQKQQDSILATERIKIQLREDASTATDERQRSSLQNQIQEWEDYAARQRKLDADDRIAQGEYWLAYRKLIFEMQDGQRPSALNFGLL